MRFSKRMDNLAPYLFAEMERKIAEKRKAGVDVISLGIGDPDLPTPAVHRRRDAAPGGRPGQRPLSRATGDIPTTPPRRPPSTSAASAWTSTPTGSSWPCSAPRKGWRTSASRCSTPATWLWCPTRATRCTRAAPSWRAPRCAICISSPRTGFLPDLDAVSEEDARRAKVLFIGYPNNPTGGRHRGRLLRAGGGVRQEVRHRRHPRQRLLRTHLRRLCGSELPGGSRAPRTWASSSSASPSPST